MDTPGDIGVATANILKNYNAIRGKNADDLKQQFWDVVVLTTADISQAKAFEWQIQDKLKRKEIPGVSYHVFADPPGPKSGCGGSTMYVIGELFKKYDVKLWDYRILLLNAGGQSQRLPSASVLGKIFMALPIDPFYQVLDLKLALYLPLLERMQPGVFHAAADTIELYDVGKEGEWDFKKPGFTAVAHPSSLKIGTGHGVYVLEDVANSGQPKLVEFRSCQEVLQKPSVEKMRERGAVQKHSDAQGRGEQQEFVYTDSCFFFDHDVSKKLMTFYNEESPLECEIDSYGDFLQPLGPLATSAYTKDIKNVAKVEPKLVETREKIFNLLKGTSLNVVLLNSSKFCHFGTMKECLDHFCKDRILSKEIGFRSHVFSVFPAHEDVEVSKKPRKDEHLDGCVMHSSLPASSTLARNSIVEYCHFGVPLRLGDGCIISNCAYTDDELREIVIPRGTFLHSTIIDNGQDEKYVTVMFGIDDNLKKTVDKAADLTYMGKALLISAEAWKLSKDEMFAVDQPVSLWNARLFPAACSMNESMALAQRMICAVRDEEALDLSEYSTFSMNTLLAMKDSASLLKYRQDLYKHISTQLSN